MLSFYNIKRLHPSVFSANVRVSQHTHVIYKTRACNICAARQMRYDSLPKCETAETYIRTSAHFHCAPQGFLEGHRAYLSYILGKLLP